MKVFVDKTICKYLFVHDLSGWHYSANRAFRKEWSSHPNKLSVIEKEALNKWSALSRNVYTKEHEFLVSLYILGKLNNKQQIQIDEIFEVLEKRFEYHFHKQKRNLKNVAAFLSKVAANKYIKTTLELYKQRQKISKIYVTLSHAANKSAGGMVVGSAVAMQFGDYKIEAGSNEPILGILFHEITHYDIPLRYFKKNTSIKLPAKFDGDPHEYIEEIIHRGLWSYVGVLNQKAFNISNAEIDKRTRFLNKVLPEPNKSILRDMVKIKPLLVELIQKKTDLNQNWINRVIEAVKL